MTQNGCRHGVWNLDGEGDVLFVAYGTVARICKTAIEALTARGVEAELFRPITPFPYPGEALEQAAQGGTS
jgi:2-oxoglutarate ferredoxin oxidoreductase subunit alpha